MQRSYPSTYLCHLTAPFIALDLDYTKFNIHAWVKGGGLMGQSVAVGLGIARELIKKSNHLSAWRAQDLDESQGDGEISNTRSAVETDIDHDLTPAEKAANSLHSTKKKLKVQRLLTRDSRCKERKKFGRKKARKKSQFSKR